MAAAVVALSAFSAYCARMATRRPPPVAFFATATTLDLGRLRQGDHGTGEFTLTNGLVRPVRIEQVLPTCGCTAAEPEARDLKPGQSTKLRVTYDAGNSRGRMFNFVQVVHREAGAVGTRTLTLKVSADVEPDYDVRDPDFQFRPGEAATHALTFAPRLIPSLTIRGAYCTHPAFTASFRPASAGGRGGVVAVAFDPALLGDDPNFWDARLVVETDGPHEPTYRRDLILHR